MTQGRVRGHNDLRVWNESIELTVEVYRMTEAMPSRELYGLTAQMRRAAVSVAANIAEGAGRGSKAEFARFIAIASGSLSELDTHVILCQRLELLDDVASIRR